MVDIQAKVHFMVKRKSHAIDDLNNTARKVKAGAKAMGNKIRNPDRP
jgi:hypothetical protein